MPLFQLPDSPCFPPPELALDEPNGLLAIGGELTTPWLLEAYRHGIFPWFNEDDPLLWWSPDPRMVLETGNIHVSRSLRKALRKGGFRVTANRAFADVIRACAAPRQSQPEENAGTWITDDMQAAYIEFHRAGYAHSIEVWQEDALVGGLYGVGIDRMFFGESMFSRVSNASKIALVHLCRTLEQRGVPMIDCQMSTSHLASLGAHEIPRETFQAHLARYCQTTATLQLPGELDAPMEHPCSGD